MSFFLTLQIIPLTPLNSTQGSVEMEELQTLKKLFGEIVLDLLHLSIEVLQQKRNDRSISEQAWESATSPMKIALDYTRLEATVSLLERSLLFQSVTVVVFSHFILFSSTTRACSTMRTNATR